MSTPILVETLLKNLDGEKAAVALNTPEGKTFLTALIEHARWGQLIANALNRRLESTDPETAEGSDFLSRSSEQPWTPDALLAKALNDNPNLTQDLLIRPGKSDWEIPCRHLLKDCSGNAAAGSRLDQRVLELRCRSWTDSLITNIDPEMVSNVINNALNPSPRGSQRSQSCHIPGYTMFEVLWFKVQSYWMPCRLMEIPMWTHITAE